MKANKDSEKIEQMKELWAEAGISPHRFYCEYYAGLNYKTYPEFLELVNVLERFDSDLQLAVKKLKRNLLT